MRLRSFREGLEASIGKDCAVRPFVCDGSPRDCKAFIVGINPASPSDVPFWRSWDDESGFDKRRWYEHYLAERKAKCKRASPTRQRIERIVCAAAPVKILETNLYGATVPRARDLRIESEKTDVLEYLLSTISPSIILLHGSVVRKYFEKHHGFSPLQSGFSRAKIYRKTVAVAAVELLAVRHLAFVSYADASKLGKDIRCLGEGCAPF